MAQVNYLDPSNYKHCMKKQYDIYVCKPSLNTVVINKLEQADVVRQLGGKEFFTADAVANMQQSNPQLFDFLQNIISQGKAYVVNYNTPFVLAGTLGELWCIDVVKLTQKYTFVSNGQPMPINNQSFNQRSNGDVLDWQVVRTRPDNSKAWACFIPRNQQGQVQTSWGAVLNINGVGVQHGKGDFVIAQDAGGKPNLDDIYVVNGNIFATTYNNQGWTDCLDKKFLNAKSNNITINQLPKLVDIAQVNNLSSNIEKFRALFQKYGVQRFNNDTTDAFLSQLNSKQQEEVYAYCKAFFSRCKEVERRFFNGIKFDFDDQLIDFKSDGINLEVSGPVVQNKSQALKGLSDVPYIQCLIRLGQNKKLMTAVFGWGSVEDNDKVNPLNFNVKKLNDSDAFLSWVKSLSKNSASLFSILERFYHNLYNIFSYEFQTNREVAPESALVDPNTTFRFSFKERDMSSEKSSTIFMKLVDGKLNVRAKREGKTFDKVYSMNISLDKNNSGLVLANLAYLELCKELKITPYRFITSQRYIQNVLDVANNTVAGNYDFIVKMDVPTFKREKKSEHGTNLSMSAFNTQYIDSREGVVKSSYNTIIRLKINNQALQAAIQDLKNYIKSGSYNTQNYDAFRLDVKVANGNYQTTNNPAEFENLIINTIVEGFNIERQRQASSNAKYVKGKRDNAKEIGKAEFRELIKNGLSKYGDVTTKLEKMNPNDDSNYIIDIRIKQNKDFNIGFQIEFGNNTNSHSVAWSYDSNGKRIDSYGEYSGIVCSICFTKEVAEEIVATSIKVLR